MNNLFPESYHKNSPPNFEQIPNAHFFIKRVSNQKPTREFLHHYHDCYELYYLYSGERYYFIQDKTYHVTDGSFVLIPPLLIKRKNCHSFYHGSSAIFYCSFVFFASASLCWRRFFICSGIGWISPAAVRAIFVIIGPNNS